MPREQRSLLASSSCHSKILGALIESTENVNLNSRLELRATCSQVEKLEEYKDVYVFIMLHS